MLTPNPSTARSTKQRADGFWQWIPFGDSGGRSTEEPRGVSPQVAAAAHPPRGYDSPSARYHPVHAGYPDTSITQRNPGGESTTEGSEERRTSSALVGIAVGLVILSLMTSLSAITDVAVAHDERNRVARTDKCTKSKNKKKEKRGGRTDCVHPSVPQPSVPGTLPPPPPAGSGTDNVTGANSSASNSNDGPDAPVEPGVAPPDPPPVGAGGGADQYAPWDQGVARYVTQSPGYGGHSTYYTRDAWDFAGSMGSTIRAAHGGRIYAARGGCAPSGSSSCNNGWGNYVLQVAPDGACSIYGHLSGISVSANQDVARYGVIGQMGSSGNSTGSHLHFGRMNCSSQQSLPSSFIDIGFPGAQQWVTSGNHPDGSRLENLEIHSSPTIDVTAGDSSGFVVTATYRGPALECGRANAGTIDDSAIAYRDDRAGFWPNSAYRAPGRVAAVGCNGTLDDGEQVRWDFPIYVPPNAQPGEVVVGTMQAVYEGAYRFGPAYTLRVRIHSDQPSGNPTAYSVRWVTQTNTGPLRHGEQRELSVTLENNGLACWFPDGPYPVHLRGVNPRDRTSAFLDPNDPVVVGGGKGVRLPREVCPGEQVTIPIPIRVADSIASGNYSEYWALVSEQVTWFGENLGIFHPITVVKDTPSADPTDYSMSWGGQTYTPPLRHGDSSPQTVTLTNTGRACWFPDGPYPVHLRGVNPRDRTSAFLDPNDPNVVGGGRGVRLPGVVCPGEKVVITLPFRVPDSIPPGDYKEYFALVAEQVTWFGDNLGIHWPITVVS